MEKLKLSDYFSAGLCAGVYDYLKVETVQDLQAFPDDRILLCRQWGKKALDKLRSINTGVVAPPAASFKNYTIEIRGLNVRQRDALLEAIRQGDLNHLINTNVGNYFNDRVTVIPESDTPKNRKHTYINYR